MIGQNIQGERFSELFVPWKNNDSVLEIFFLRSKHSERGTTSLARIASIINEETEKRYLCCPTH